MNVIYEFTALKNAISESSTFFTAKLVDHAKQCVEMREFSKKDSTVKVLSSIQINYSLVIDLNRKRKSSNSKCTDSHYA